MDNNYGSRIGKNSIIYMIKTVVGLLLPLITYPYVMRILSVESMGAINFANSIISYFSLLAMLGINTFAIRNGAKYRSSRSDFTKFASEIFTINLITTVFSYILFIMLFTLNTKWHDYSELLFIFSVSIPLTTLGVEWVYTIYEDYVYITVRSLLFQLISVVFLFLFVKTGKDVMQYAIYTVLATSGSNILNFIRVKKYVQLKFIFTERMKQYIKPILVLFASSVAASIYLNSDITILGYLRGDNDVGMYNSAVKLYTVSKTVLTAVVTVSMPTLSFLVGSHKDEEYHRAFDKLFQTIFFVSVPAALGLSVVSYNIIVLFAGSSYYFAGLYLKVLALALIPSTIGSFMASGCLVLFGKETKILQASIAGALVNIVLNMIFIPEYGTVVATITTLIAEILTTCMHLYNSRNILNYKNSFNSMVKTLVSAIVMYLLCLIVVDMISNSVLALFVTIGIGMMVYLVLSLLLKNKSIYTLLGLVKR